MILYNNKMRKDTKVNNLSMQSYHLHVHIPYIVDFFI